MRWMLLSIVLVLTGAVPVLASEVNVADLDSDPARYDGREVTVTGEIVGDYGVRSEGVWVHVNDDPYSAAPLLERSRPAGTNRSIGVRIPPRMFDESWGEPGRYGTRGPIVRVTGTFRHNDPDQGGETFIQAEEVELVEATRPVGDDRSTAPMAVGVVLVLFGAAALARAWYRQTPG